MDAVLADPAPGHDDQIPWFNRFFMAGLAVHDSRHEPGRTAEDQRFAAEALVKDDGAVDGRNAAFVAAMLHPFNHPFEDSPRVQESCGERLGVERIGKAEDIGVEDQFRPLAGAERIAIDADNAGQCPAVRVEGRGGVVGLDLEDQRMSVVELDDPGVVLEDGQAEITLPQLFPDIFGRSLDERLEEGLYLLFGAVFILIMNGPGKDLVLAVL